MSHTALLLLVPLALLVAAVVLARRARPAAPRLGPYVLGERLGEGVLGIVYRAHHPGLDRWCAIELAHPDLSADARDRFVTRARQMARCSDPNVASVHDLGQTPDGRPYVVMELVEGPTLGALVRTHGPLAPERVATLLRPICGGLRTLHDHGLVHGNVTPQDVIVTRDEHGREQAKLLRHGLGVEAAKHGRLIGCPAFLSPEAIASPERVGPASDVYGLGALAFYLLTAEPVFEGTLVEVCRSHLDAAPLAPSDLTGASSWLDDMILACLAKDPSDRPASMAEVDGRLARGLAGEVAERRRRVLRPRSVLRFEPSAPRLCGAASVSAEEAGGSTL